MTLVASTAGKADLLNQARKCRMMGSPFVASVLEAADRNLLAAPITAKMIMGWHTDPAASALALRINGALHALARRGNIDHLSELYRGTHNDFDGAVAAAFSEQDQFIADWIRHPTQTNEVARAAAIMAALMTVQGRAPMPFDLLELGTSCGLNLNLDRYHFELGSVSCGDPDSNVRISPQWRGTLPSYSPVTVSSARGVDLLPLDASQAADRERLLAFVWADQPARSRRLNEALGLAIRYPPRIDRGNAVDWLSERLNEPQSAGHCRVVMHTMFQQYLSAADRDRINALIAAAGDRSTPDRPILKISFEWTSDRAEVELRMTCWPDGAESVLARCHPYGEWIEWSGLAVSANRPQWRLSA